MVKLRPMRDKEYQHFIKYSSDDYARQQVNNGKWTQAEANEWLENEDQFHLPQGKDTPLNHFFRITNIQDMPVGYLWIIEKNSDHGKTAYINDILIDKNQRRKGYALSTLGYLEEWCRERDFQTIALHVFNDNAQAQKLYNRAGFSPKNDLSEIWTKHLL